MAAPPFDPSYVAANPFDIYTDTPIIKTPNPNLPGGHCNFVDLTPGANGAKCGCRRFWSRSSGGALAPDQNHWCMCNHHACYHEEGDRDAQFPDIQFPDVQLPNQENEKPRTGREPLSPVVDWTLKTPPAVPGMDFPSFSAPENLSFLNRTPGNVNPINRMPASQATGASLPDTLSWGGLIQSQPQAAPLPPIPSQCLMPSQTASTTSSAQAKYLRPFAGKGLQTLSGLAGARPPESLGPESPQVTAPPAPEGSTAPAESFVFVAPDRHDSEPARVGTPSQVDSRPSSFSGMGRRAFKNLTETVSSHDQRLDRLETVSFAASGHDECQEKHDHADLRITELESRVDEVEKLVNDNQSVVSRRDDASVISVSTSATSRPTHSQEMYSQVQSLQAQLAHLQSMVPSSNHPWAVEVVFLPFPLKKVWQEAHEFKTEPVITSDDWTQLPMTYSTTTLRSQSPLYADWANTGSEDMKWLLPKAYSDKSIVDQRLRSRGLIKTVTVRGCDARSVALAMDEAFGHVFREMQMFAHPQAADARMATFLGLQSAWVPLRKIHKDSRLRFLSPAEMATPALWNVQFLTSVVMKSSEPRLFVTHPNAYLQDVQSYDAGWTWQRLKQMNPVDVEAGESQTGAELEAASWSWAEVLDEAPAATASVSMSRDRQRTISSSPSQPFFPAVQMIRSSSPSLIRSQSSLLASRRGSRPPHIRTSSMPLAGPSYNSPASSRRRVASYGQSRRSSPALHAVPQSAIVKRRRSTRSPSRHRMTPGWTASPSPMPLGLSDRQPVRGTTPFAYATPYSNAPLQEVRGIRGGSMARAAPEFASEDEAEFEVNMDESGSDDFYDDEDSIGSLEMAQVEVTAGPESQPWQLPEDEPWPGIEDQNHMSDTENIDPQQEGSQGSNVSSQPSEYPSTQSAWPTNDNAEFEIHEDDTYLV